MMKKGLIMELKKDYAIMLNDDGSMDKIVIKPGMAVGQKIFYFDEDIIKVSSSSQGKFKYNVFMKSFGSIAALFLIAFTFFYNMNINRTCAIVSLDINPSIQIEVDNNAKIIKVEGMNDDGKSIDFTGIKGCNINEGIKTIKDILVEKEYLKNNKDVLVGVAFVKDGDKAAYEENIKEAVFSTFDTETIAYIKAEDKDDVIEAKEQGISLGRYEASKAVADEETKKKIINAPVKEITEQIKDKENVIYYDSEDNKTEANEDKPSVNVPADKPAAGTSADVNTNSSSSNNSTNKNQDSNTNQKPDINAKADENKEPVQSDKNEDSSSKSEINNGILELEPEKPAEIDKNQNSKPNGEGNTIIDPDKNIIENNATSGKIEEDNVQEITPDISTEQAPVQEEVK
ncbi:anti-sigma factor domain-containing protein [uncultured Clostridium sp.]|uniref:anti-sigma-I factor RsgI family protein n=1 Tax=uncultured Clostridium sp. TaxID=59620 RepID=UPI0025DE8B66|nr:anti-sigma factor domain-containing protein [uncultured Clostridium sp.]